MKGLATTCASSDATLQCSTMGLARAETGGGGGKQREGEVTAWQAGAQQAGLACVHPQSLPGQCGSSARPDAPPEAKLVQERGVPAGGVQLVAQLLIRHEHNVCRRGEGSRHTCCRSGLDRGVATAAPNPAGPPFRRVRCRVGLPADCALPAPRTTRTCFVHGHLAAVWRQAHDAAHGGALGEVDLQGGGGGGGRARAGG